MLCKATAVCTNESRVVSQMMQPQAYNRICMEPEITETAEDVEWMKSTAVRYLIQ